MEGEDIMELLRPIRDQGSTQSGKWQGLTGDNERGRFRAVPFSPQGLL